MRKSVDWKKVDWSQQDVALASQLGCSRERVRQVRKQLCKPRPEGYHRRTIGSARLKLAEQATEIMALPKISELAGCKPARARSVLKELGKGYKRRPNGHARYDWSRFPAGWRSMTDHAIGLIVGASNPAIVAQWRNRHGFSKKPTRATGCVLEYP